MESTQGKKANCARRLFCSSAEYSVLTTWLKLARTRVDVYLIRICLFVFSTTSVAFSYGDEDREDYYSNIIPGTSFNEQYVFPSSDSGSTPSRKSIRNEIIQGIKSSFALPWYKLYEKKYESEWRNAFDGTSVGFSFSEPLLDTPLRTSTENATQGDQSATNRTMAVSFKYSPLPNWFLSTAIFEYQNEEQQAPWNPDFVYSFGYSDWRPYTLSLVYANYGGNRLNPGEGETSTEFRQGSVTLGWKFPLGQNIARYFVLSSSGRIGCNTGISWVPEYFDAATSLYKRNKYTPSLGCKYTIAGNWYINGTVFNYPNHDQKQPWNPDYTYGFGYFDYRPGKLSLQYNNYSGNRFPWNAKSPGTGKFKNGSISLSISWSF